MKAVDLKTSLIKEARYACIVNTDASTLAMLDIDYIETEVSEIIWHQIAWPLQREIEDDER